MKNIKILALAAMLSFAATNTYAEEDEATTKFGITTGIGAGAMAAGDYLGAGGPMVPLNAFGEYKFDDWFGLRGSLRYTFNKQKGTKVDSNDSKEGVIKRLFEVMKDKSGSDQTLHAIDIALIGRFYPGSGRHFCIYIGPGFGLVFGAEGVDLKDGVFGKTAINLNAGWDYELDCGVIFGAGGSVLGKHIASGVNVGYNFAKLLN